MTLVAYVQGIGLSGPALNGWEESRDILAGKVSFVPQPTVVPIPAGLPPAERRRMGAVVKLALSVGLQACAQARVEPANLPAVFTSSGGDGPNCHEICQALATSDRQLSPTRFHNSVHNAAAGYWSIATGAKTPSNALCAHDASFTAGLLEAMTQVVIEHTTVLLVAYDAQYPQPLFDKRPIPDAFGAAFVLSPHATSGAIARLHLTIRTAPSDQVADAGLERLRRTIPAARSLPLLCQLARRASALVRLDYLDDQTLAVDVQPCV
ncbi:MAG TPA: beta-ketoacyl synthase chain length factor [Steroidobacteraceae bacterium]